MCILLFYSNIPVTNMHASSSLCSGKQDCIDAQGDLVQQGEVYRAQTAAQQAQLQALQSQRVRQHPLVGRGSGIHAYQKQTNAYLYVYLSCVLIFCEHNFLI